MAMTCPRCGAEYDVTLFVFDRRIRCDCGEWVDLSAGHRQSLRHDSSAGAKTAIEGEAHGHEQPPPVKHPGNDCDLAHPAHSG
jgi:hypothetical protein